MEAASSSSSSSVIQLGGSSNTASRLIDRYNPIIRGCRRIGGSSRIQRPLPPCSSPPKPKKKKNNKTSSSSSTTTTTSSKLPLKETNYKKKGNNNWSCRKGGEFITPPGSSRYLLSTEKDLFDYHHDPVLKVAVDESSTPKQPPSSSPSKDQVVVLRVSLHCRGCEKKMRKHLSRMQGVKSFNIDFAAQKVEVIGDVTPLEVLASISKVKNAQLWPPTLASLPKPNNLINSELKNITKESIVWKRKISEQR